MTEPPQDDRWAALAADHAEVALAVFDAAGALVWANATMTRDARGLGLDTDAGYSVEQLGEAVEASAGRYRLATAPVGDTTVACLICASPPVAEPNRDPITGVLDRREIEREIERRFAAADAAPFALVFLDLDDFKSINDQQGHLVGDECLREVGARLRGAVRSGDAVGRFGGDEFVVLLDGVSRHEELEPVWTRLGAVGAGPSAGASTGASTEPRPFGVSAGVAFSVDGYRDPDEMIHAADRQMYEAKRAKRGG